MIYTNIIQITNISLFIIFVIIYIYFSINNINNIEYLSNDFSYKVYYINLLDRTDRNKVILSELYKCNVSKDNIHRINADKKEIGSYGCLLSHVKTLKKAMRDNVDYAVILEDDFIFRKKINVTDMINDIKDIDWDVCLLSGNTIKLLNKIKNNLYRVSNSQTTSGYIVKKQYIHKLLHFWKNTIVGEKKGIDYSNMDKSNCNNSKGCPYTQPADQSWKKLQKKDNWIIIHPTIGYQRKSYSDIEQKIVDYKV
jgi:hypothetical protein